MKRQLLLGIACIFSLFGTVESRAELIGVNFDDFSNLSLGTATLNVGGILIERTLSSTGSVALTPNNLSIGRDSSVTVTYEVLGGQDFGDVFATSGFPASFFNGFGVFASVHPPLAMTDRALLSIFPDIGTPVVNETMFGYGLNPTSPVFYTNIAFPSTSSVVFTIENLRPAGRGNQFSQSIDIKGFYAVGIPEPSALLLVGAPLIGLLGLRRRKLV
jgi:hypothetical protein